MSLFSTKNISKTLIINFLFSFIIVSFLAGNLVINLNILLIIIFSLFFYKKKIFEVKIDLFDKIIILLFSYILICSFLNNIVYFAEGSDKNFSVFLKSIFFLRFLILYFVIKFLIKEEILNFKIFFITSLVCVTFVCIDIIYQLIFGYDIFGYEANSRRLSGPFGDEPIAGSYIQRFSIIALFAVYIFFKFKKNYTKYIFIAFLVSLFTFALILSGNRIPLLFFILIISFIILFEKPLRKFLLPFLFVPFLLIIIVANISENYRYHLISFVEKTLQMTLIFSSKNLLTVEEEKKNEIDDFYLVEYKGKKYKLLNSHLKEFRTGYATWNEKKIFGGGIKSFGINCPKAKTINCGRHPHNYYLEVLASLGLVGFFIIVYLFYKIFMNTFIMKYFKKSLLKDFHLITPFIFLFFSEVMPIKSTGSFFTTGNATYIFLLLSILISLTKKKLD